MAEAETTVQQIVESQPRVKVVTGENFNDYVNEQLGIDPEAIAKEELEKVEAEKAARKSAEGNEEVDLAEVPEKKKGKINERFKELTDKRKEAEALAAKRAEELRAAREERDRIEAEKNELLAKYEPPKSDEIGPEPQASQFSDVGEFAKALKDWTAEKTRIDDAAKQRETEYAKRQQETEKAWSERLASTKAEVADYEDVIGGSDVKVSDQVRDAIIESEVGPKILYHLAKNPDVAQKIGELTVGGALRAIGRLEAELGGKPQAKTSTVAEISKAPAPISPLKGAHAPVGTLTGKDEVPKNWSYEDWKKARQAGKIH